ncbi:MAG: acetoacetate--CoA ligase [Acidimicrobiales bacterium]
MTDRPLWTPSPERVAAASITRFAGGPFDYTALHRISVDDMGMFWSKVWDHAEVLGDKGRINFAAGHDMASVRFFPDAHLNVAQNLLRGGGPAAVIAIDESGGRRQLSWDALRAEVGALAAWLGDRGVGAGDRVVAWMPNVPETLVTMLAAAALGAVFSSTSPDFGVDGVIDRFGQIEPKVLVATTGYRYGGKAFDCLERLGDIQARLPTLRGTLLVGANRPAPATTPWAEALAFGDGCVPRFERMPFDHPWYVLFSSGTTGKPKCIVHRAGGVLLKHLEEHQLQCDVGPDDRFLYFTTPGWMMWNWLASVLASQATVVLFDGSPFHPGPDALWDLTDAEGVTLFGTSAKYIDSMAKAGRRPMATHRLDTVRTIVSTGSPLSPESFVYVYDAVKTDVHLASISGGTDLCGCFVGSDPTGPVWAGEIQRPALGMAVGVAADDGRLLGPGEKGELVCTAPFPSLPLGFWGDDDGSRYRAAYFDKRPGMWSHGDFASWTEHGGIVIHGRSDATLNPGGVRIGTAELYRQVEQMPEVLEALAFARDVGDDVEVVLLVRLDEGITLDDDLEKAIRTRIRTGCSPRHVPALIVPVDDLPRTRSGKLAELAVADAVNGRTVRSTEGLADSATLWTAVDRVRATTY